MLSVSGVSDPSSHPSALLYSPIRMIFLSRIPRRVPLSLPPLGNLPSMVTDSGTQSKHRRRYAARVFIGSDWYGANAAFVRRKTLLNPLCPSRAPASYPALSPRSSCILYPIIPQKEVQKRASPSASSPVSLNLWCSVPRNKFFKGYPLMLLSPHLLM